MPALPHPRTALSGYADARLPGWQRALVARHLRRCTRCAVEVGQIRAVGELLRAAPPEPPPGLLDRLLALGGEAAGPVDGAAAGDVAAAGPPDPEAPAAPEAPGAPVRPGAPAAHVPGPAGPVATGPGVLVAAAVLLGTVVAGAAVTGVGLPGPQLPGRPALPSSATSLLTVLPRPWSGTGAPDGAHSVRPVDDGQRP